MSRALVLLALGVGAAAHELHGSPKDGESAAKGCAEFQPAAWVSLTPRPRRGSFVGPARRSRLGPRRGSVVGHGPARRSRPGPFVDRSRSTDRDAAVSARGVDRQQTPRRPVFRLPPRPSKRGAPPRPAKPSPTPATSAWPATARSTTIPRCRPPSTRPRPTTIAAAR